MLSRLAIRAVPDQIGAVQRIPSEIARGDQRRFVDDCFELLRTGEQTRQRRTHRVARLLHRSQQEDVQRGVDVVAVACLPPLGHAVVQPVRDGAVVGGVLDPMVDERIDDRSDLLLGPVAFVETLLAGEVPVLVHRRVGERIRQLVEPLAQRVRGDVLQPEQVAEGAHAHRLAVLGDEIRLAVGFECLDVALRDGTDEILDPPVHFGGLECRFDHGAQVPVDVAVDADDRGMPKVRPPAA